MERIVFKNQYVNIVVGTLLVLLSILGYLMDWFADFLPYFIGVLLVLLSIRRFTYTFKKITSKNATLILVIELLLDFVFAGLLIFLQDHMELFVGLVIYIRGVSYLLINYIATRKINIGQYLLNIVYLTFGAFLMFYPLNSEQFIIISIAVLLLLFGAIFLQSGISQLTKQRKKRKLATPKTPIVKEPENTKKEPSESNIVKPEKKVSSTPKINYESMTVPELKSMAKEKNLQGYSQLNKSELIEKLKKESLKNQ